MDKMIVVVFDTEPKAYEASRALADLHREGNRPSIPPRDRQERRRTGTTRQGPIKDPWRPLSV